MLQALRSEIIVKPIYEEKRGVIVVPESAKRFLQYHGSVSGLVISVGPKSEFKDEVKPGDRIVWVRNEGKKIVYEGQEYLAVRDRWVRGKIVEPRMYGKSAIEEVRDVQKQADILMNKIIDNQTLSR